MTAGPVFYFSVVGRETEAEGKTITREHCEASTGRPAPAAATERLSERSEFGADSSESARGRGAAKVMFLSGDQIHRRAAAGIKMRHEVLSVCIDSHHDSLMLRLSFENALLIGQQY